MAHPPRDQIPARTLQRVRKLCLAFPETSEKLAWGHPTFRVRDKIFATIGVDEDGKRVTMTTKPPPGEQEALLAEGDTVLLPEVRRRARLDRLRRQLEDRLEARGRADRRLLPGDRAEAGRRSARRALISIANW